MNTYVSVRMQGANEAPEAIIIEKVYVYIYVYILLNCYYNFAFCVFASDDFKDK